MVKSCDICGVEMFCIVWDLWGCTNCGLISSDLKPKIDIYDQSYFDKYIEYSKTLVGTQINETRYKAVKDTVGESNLLVGKRLLDFGCGSGSFVEFMRNRTMAMVKGYDVIPGSPYNEPSLPRQFWDIVTFWDSIEHTSSPKTILTHLSPEYVIICVPSIDGNEKESLIDWRHYRPHEHIHYYNEKSLKALLRACGYKIELINYDESNYRKGENSKNILTIGGILK